MKVFVSVTSFQGCIDEVQLFLTEEEVDAYTEKWEMDHDITDEDTRDYESGQGTEIVVHEKELVICLQ